MAYILYFLMWHISCISWCGVQYIVSPDVAYILFLAFPDTAHILYFLMWHTFCISWCGVRYIGSTDIWRMYCSSDINNISWYGVHPFFSYVAYFLYFLMWCTLHCVSWYGVYIVRQISMMFPGMSHSLVFLMWLVSCISFFWCSLHCRSWSGIYIVLQIYITYAVWRTSFITWCGVLFVFPDVTYNILYLLMWRIYLSSDIDSISW